MYYSLPSVVQKYSFQTPTIPPGRPHCYNCGYAQWGKANIKTHSGEKEKKPTIHPGRPHCYKCGCSIPSTFTCEACMHLYAYIFACLIFQILTDIIIITSTIIIFIFIIRMRVMCSGETIQVLHDTWPPASQPPSNWFPSSSSLPSLSLPCHRNGLVRMLQKGWNDSCVKFPWNLVLLDALATLLSRARKLIFEACKLVLLKSLKWSHSSLVFLPRALAWLGRMNGGRGAVVQIKISQLSVMCRYFFGFLIPYNSIAWHNCPRYAVASPTLSVVHSPPPQKVELFVMLGWGAWFTDVIDQCPSQRWRFSFIFLPNLN